MTETLNLLEWPRLCQHLATFAATKIGSLACHDLDPWVTRQRTEMLLAQTDEAIRLDASQPGGLSLRGIHNLGGHLDRAERGGLLQGAELEQVASTLSSARRVRRLIDDREDIPVLQDLVDSIRTYPEIEQEIGRCLDDRGEVRDGASERLQSLRERLRQIRIQIQEQLERLISSHSNAVQEPVIRQREGRYVLPVKATHRDQIRGLVHDSSGSGATLYVEPFGLVEPNNQLRQLQAQARAEEERILQALSEQVGSVADDLRHLQAVMTELDLALARARYGLWLGGNRPRFMDAGLRLRQVRHPLLAWQMQHEGQVVPIDFTLRPEVRVVVITGPNTGGKTVALKTLGLLALMAKVGIFLPVREPVELPWFDRILADIGDEQSLQQSLSTFSGHIRRIGRILAQIPPDGSALVLLDEVGAGTDPTEGSALAAALLEHLGQRAQMTLATTHYGELKSLKYQHPHFENASVEFDEASLAPTYRLLWGIPGRSNALTIAQRLDLDPAVLQQAATRLQGGSSQVDAVIVGLERQRAAWEAKTRQAESLYAELEALQQQMQQRYQRLSEREADLNRGKTQAIQSAIQAARGEIAAVIRRLQQGDATGQSAQQATATLDRIEARLRPEPPVPTEFYPEVGDRVRLRGLDQTGEVIERNGEEFVIRSGILKFNAQLTQLAPLDDHQAKQRQRPVKPPPPATAPLQIRTSRNTLDLRGKNVADAEIAIDQFMAESGSGPIWIIHGHGTGKLRAGVQEYLRHHPRVASLAAAEANDGGTGVTVAQLR